MFQREASVITWVVVAYRLESFPSSKESAGSRLPDMVTVLGP